MINEGSKRVLFTKKQITTLANEFAGFFKGFTFGKEGEALLSKEILKQYFQEALKHDTYEESVDITKPKLSLFLKMIKRDDSVFFRLYEVKNRKESDILKITLNSTTNNWSVRRLDLNERETMKSKIIKEGYSNNGYGMSDDALSFIIDGEIESEQSAADEEGRDVSNLDNFQYSNQLLEANKAYGHKIFELLTSWLHENLDKMTDLKTLFQKGLIDSSEYKSEDPEQVYLDLLMRHRGGAVFLYFMEYRHEGVGTWDGDWDILFVDGRNTVNELRKYIKKNSSKEAEVLQTAIYNNVYEYVNGYDDDEYDVDIEDGDLDDLDELDESDFEEDFDVKIDFKDLNESFNRILKEYNGDDDTDVVIYTGRNIKAWIPTDSAYARDLARGWITVIIYNEKTHEEIWLEGTNDGDFMVSQIDGRSANEDFDESACAEYLSCDEEEAESIYENISNYDYGEFLVGLLDGTEDDPTHEMVQEAIAEAKQDSKENLIEFACEFADEDSCSEINDEMADEIIEKYNEYGVYDDFYVEWEWDGNPVVEPITYGEGSDPRIIKAIKYVLFAHGILSDEALEEMHSQGIYPEEEDNDQTDLFESYNMLYRRYLNEDDSYKWDKELDTDDLQYLIDQEFPKYEDRYEFSEHPQADHFAVDTFDTFLRRCKNIVEKFADENGLSFYDILEDIRGPYQLAIYNYLNGDLSHIMNDHPKKLDLDAMARDDIRPQFEHLQKAIRNCIKSYIV